MTIDVMCKQYYETVCQLDMRRKFLKEQLEQCSDEKKCKDFEMRIGILTEEISETKEIAKFLNTRYGGDSLYDENFSV